MIVASIFIGYYLSMTILLTKNKTFNLQKVYTSLLMGLLMGLVETIMMIWMITMNGHGSVRPLLIIFLLLIIGSFIVGYLYINQIGIGQTDFLRGMIEHHQMAVEMAEKVKPKLTNDRVKQLVDNIITTQTQEINDMKLLIKY